MCGILGILNLDSDKPVDEAVLRSMAGTITHRGPDDDGFYINGNISIGMRRLSIIDIETGRQPIPNEDKSVYVVLNGEIYNYPELRQLLINKGHHFRTHSDTEVIVHLYEEYGDDLVDYLNGMFAFALWDNNRRRLLAARDRMGEKPFYYTITTDRKFIFASEMKALTSHPSVEHKISPVALRKYLQYEFVPSPHTMIEGIFKLRPGHRLIFENGKIYNERYWGLNYDKQKLKISEDEAASEVRRRLLESVRMRMISDVPLGILLSGGIDSSTIAALACEASSQIVKTFSISFEEKSFDESTYAKAVARRLGTDHYEQCLSEREMLDIIPAIPQLIDEPLGDASIIPTYLLSRFTRQHVTVALGGDGGDELLAGYPTYTAHRMADYYGSIPAFLRHGLIEPSIAGLPVSMNNLSLDFKLKRFVAGANLPPGTRHTVWMGSFTPDQQKALLSKDFQNAYPNANVFDEIEYYDQSSRSDDIVEKMMTLDATHYLSECVLFKVDRASMAASLETRAPFLDHTLIEYLTTLPTGLKLKGLTGKYILKKAMRNSLPEEVIKRPKKGFGIPVAKWINSCLRPLIHDTFNSARLKEQGLFNPDYVQKLLTEHESGKADHRKLIWTLLMFQLWPITSK